MLFGYFPLYFIVLYIFFVHVIGLQIEKAQSPPQRDLLSPTDNTVHKLLQTALLYSSLYFCDERHFVTHVIMLA